MINDNSIGLFGINGGWTYRRSLSPLRDMEIQTEGGSCTVKLTRTDLIVYLGVVPDPCWGMCYRSFQFGDIVLKQYMSYDILTRTILSKNGL